MRLFTTILLLLGMTSLSQGQPNSGPIAANLTGDITPAGLLVLTNSGSNSVAGKLSASFFYGDGSPLINLNPVNISSNLPLSKIAQGGASSGQVAEWNGSAWIPANIQGITIPNTITLTNFVLNQKYTNTSGSIQFIDATVALTTAAVAGQASLSLYADQSGGTTFTVQDQAKITTLLTGLAVTDTRNLIGALSNNAAYYFTNDSTGAGNSSAMSANTGELVTIGDGAAAGVPTLAGANTFTGANTFSGPSRMDSLTVTNGLTNSALTASRIMLSDANKAFASATASGAVPVDADGSATTSAQVQTLFPGTIITNNHNSAITLSNNLTIDATHKLIVTHISAAGGTPTVVTNTGGACTVGCVPTMDSNAHDSAMTINLATGSGTATPGLIFTVTYAAAYATVPHVVWSHSDNISGLLGGRPCVTNVTTSGFSFWSASTVLTVNTNYMWTFFTIE